MSTATETPTETPVPNYDTADIPALVERLRSSFDAGRTRPLSWRREQLEQLIKMVNECGDEFVDALRRDLGKPELEARAADVGQAKTEAQAALRNLAKWTRPERKGLPIPILGRSEVLREPLGVVLIIAPWNYPVGLLLSPLVGAIAAGNAAVLKPSEVTPHVSEVLARRCAEYLDTDAIALVEGGVEETTALLDERFDYIMYTGNGIVGRIVMQAAARHLTPVTLELGGKSPCIVDRTADIDLAARRIAWGKFINAGQTCIAPDYVLVHQEVEDELLAALEKTVKEFYGDDPKATPDFARIVNQRHHARLTALLKDEDVAFGGEHDVESCYIAPTVVRNPSADSALMAEEIFGPILPVLGVPDIGSAIARVNEGEKPLALYVFANDSEVEDEVLERTSSGGACVNGTIMHIANSALPFGGVGESGMGAYHGKHTFETFSHRKSVLRRGVRFDPKAMYPPYGKFANRIVKKM